MRVFVIAGALWLAAGAGCSAELAQRPAAEDPTSVAAPEAPFTPPPAYRPDPLLGPRPQPPPSPEPQPQASPGTHR